MPSMDPPVQMLSLMGDLDMLTRRAERGIGVFQEGSGRPVAIRGWQMGDLPIERGLETDDLLVEALRRGLSAGPVSPGMVLSSTWSTGRRELLLSRSAWRSFSPHRSPPVPRVSSIARPPSNPLDQRTSSRPPFARSQKSAQVTSHHHLTKYA